MSDRLEKALTIVVSSGVSIGLLILVVSLVNLTFLIV